jgi:hypothetical protein
MDQRIVYSTPDGGMAVVVPSGLPIDQIAAKDVPQDTPYLIVNMSVIPHDRTYRNAWVADLAGCSISHDMTKAREIHKDYMRRARTPLLADLDTQYMRADEAGNAASKAQISAKKQALRDVTAYPGIAAAQTVDELKQVWPSILGPNPLL